MLIIIKATAINATTRPPATKLEIKFANEVVISNTVYLQIKIKNSKINYIINYITFWKKKPINIQFRMIIGTFNTLDKKINKYY